MGPRLRRGGSDWGVERKGGAAPPIGGDDSERSSWSHMRSSGLRSPCSRTRMGPILFEVRLHLSLIGPLVGPVPPSPEGVTLQTGPEKFHTKGFLHSHFPTTSVRSTTPAMDFLSTFIKKTSEGDDYLQKRFGVAPAPLRGFPQLGVNEQYIKGKLVQILQLLE